MVIAAVEHEFFAGAQPEIDLRALVPPGTAIVTASLEVPPIHIKITGRNRNDIKDYLHELFDYALRQEAPVPLAEPAPDAPTPKC